ncbi:MAG: hypothetical protein WA857_18185 [Candidatus Acidiferrum sp.]
MRRFCNAQSGLRRSGQFSPSHEGTAGFSKRVRPAKTGIDFNP